MLKKVLCVILMVCGVLFIGMVLTGVVYHQVKTEVLPEVKDQMNKNIVEDIEVEDIEVEDILTWQNNVEPF